MKKINLYIIPVLSILTYIIIFALCYIYNSFSAIEGHDHFLVVGNYLPPTRFCSFFLGHFLNSMLPQLLNVVNITDFRAGIIGCTLTSLYYFLVLFIFSRSFFIIANKKQKSIFSFENILVLPVCFMLLTKFLVDYCGNSYLFFQGIRENWIYIDHVGGCLFYFLFFILLINIILNNKIITLKEKIFYSVIGLVLGLWTEILNLATLFSIFLILAILALCNKEKLKNTSIYYLFGSFIIGFLMYYFVVSDFSLTNIGSAGSYDILGKLAANFQDINIYFNKFFTLYFFEKKIFWIVMIVLYVIVVIQLFMRSLLNKNYKEEKLAFPSLKDIVLVLFILFSILVGFFLACSFSVFIANYRPGSEIYIMERPTFQLIGLNIFGFIITALSGIIYYNASTKIRKIFAGLIICVSLFLLYSFVPDYITHVKNKINDKLIIYNTEKTIVIYSLLGESAILPVSFHEKNGFDFLMENNFGFDNVQDYYLYTKNRYFIADYFNYRIYFNSIYKHKLKGIQFKDDEIAAIELQKRMELFGKPNEEKTKFPIIKFSDMNLYDNLNLTLDDINNKEKIFGKNDILLKVKAYINFRNKNYTEALYLYNEYLKNNPNDFDALINIAQIYEENNNIKELKNTYKKLIEIDNDNYVFNFYLMNIYYDEGNYNDALKINTKLLNQKQGLQFEDHLLNLYINQAIIYGALNNPNKMKKYLDYASEINEEQVIKFANINGIKDLNNIVNIDRKIPLRINFGRKKRILY